MHLKDRDMLVQHCENVTHEVLNTKIEAAISGAISKLKLTASQIAEDCRKNTEELQRQTIEKQAEEMESMQMRLLKKEECMRAEACEANAQALKFHELLQMTEMEAEKRAMAHANRETKFLNERDEKVQNMDSRMRELERKYEEQCAMLKEAKLEYEQNVVKCHRELKRRQAEFERLEKVNEILTASSPDSEKCKEFLKFEQEMVISTSQKDHFDKAADLVPTSVADALKTQYEESRESFGVASEERAVDVDPDPEDIGERRIDPTDGQSYSYDEFFQCYGGNEEWNKALPCMSNSNEDEFALEEPRANFYASCEEKLSNMSNKQSQNDSIVHSHLNLSTKR